MTDDLTAATAAAERAPRYLALLERERESWWDSRNFDKWKEHYISEYARGLYLLRLFGELLPGFETSGLRVLDVGCGDAGILVAFAEAGCRTAGVEPSERSLARARVRAEEHGVDIELSVGVAEALPYDDGAFDLVILDNVLEHVADQDRTLAEVRRVLRPDGYFYVVTPKPFAISSILSDPHYQLAGLVLLPRPLQVWYFERVRGGGAGSFEVGRIPTRRWLLRMLRRHGFAPVVAPRELWVRYVGHKLSAPRIDSGRLKAGAARFLSRHRWAVEHPLARWLWDVSTGSNPVLCRREP